MLLIGMGAVLACGDVDSSALDMPAVSDSSGIRVVEHSSDLSGSAIALELLWEHGHDIADYAFQFAFSGGLQPDGGAIVADGANQEIVSIGADGSLEGVLAGTGRGPTEVMGPRAVLVLGLDTIWVEDVGNAKLMRLEGGALSETISTAGDVTLTYGMMPLGAAPNGELLMNTSSYRSDFEQPWLDGHLTRFNPATRELDTVASYPMAAHVPENGRDPYSPHGVVTAAGRGFVHARTDVPELIWRQPNGAVRQVVRWRPQPRYPDAEMWERFEASLRADLRRVNPDMGGDRLQSFLEERTESYLVDSSKPVPLFGQINGTPEGAVWLPGFVPRGSRPSRYLVVSSDGTTVGAVEFPRPFRILDADEKMVLGVYVDDLDVQAVAVYRYRPSP